MERATMGLSLALTIFVGAPILASALGAEPSEHPGAPSPDGPGVPAGRSGGWPRLDGSAARAGSDISERHAAGLDLPRVAGGMDEGQLTYEPAHTQFASVLSGSLASGGSTLAGLPMRAGAIGLTTTDAIPAGSAPTSLLAARHAVPGAPARVVHESPPWRLRDGYLVVGRGEPYTVSASEPHEPYGATVERTVREAALYWGADPEQLVRVVRCESSFRPEAIGAAGERGIFQFMARTWAANSVRYGQVGASPHDPYAAADVAAQMFAQGQAWQWTCQ